MAGFCLSIDSFPNRLKVDRKGVALGRVSKEFQAVGKGVSVYKTQLPCNGCAIVIVAAFDHQSVFYPHDRAIADFGPFAGRRKIPKA